MRKIRSLICFLAGLGLILTACSSATAPTAKPSPAAAAAVASTETPAKTAAPTPSTAQTPGPKRGGTLVYGFNADPPSFDIHQETAGGTSALALPAYNNLIGYDPMDLTKIVGDLAENWEVKSGGAEYAFHLKKGVKWHDGRPFTASDVKFTFERIGKPPTGMISPRKSYMADVTAIDVPDDSTVTIKLKGPSASFLSLLAHPLLPIFSKKVVEQKGDMKRTILGTGPFVFKDYQPGVGSTMARNADYFKGAPYLDGLKAYIIPDTMTMLASLRTGRIQLIPMNPGISASSATLLKDTMSDKILVTRGPLAAWYNMVFNTKRKPFDDVRVRRAVSLAIDRKAVIKGALEGFGTVTGPMPPAPVTAWGLSDQDLQKLPGYGPDPAENLKEAKKLLAEAGYPNGFETSINTEPRPMYKDLAVVLQSEMKKGEINAKVNVLGDSAAWTSANVRGAFDLTMNSSSLAVPDPTALFGEHYISSGARNYGKYVNKEVDDLFAKQEQTLDPAERKKMVDRMQELVLDEAHSVIAYSPDRFMAHSRDVHDYKMPSSSYSAHSALFLEHVWLGN